MNCLNYSKWSNFKKVISKAIKSCENSDISVFDHFADVGKMVQIGSDAQREQKDYKITRYACLNVLDKKQALETFKSRDAIQYSAYREIKTEI